MALSALICDDEGTVCPATVASLRSWLRGDWTLWFSHPDDFAAYGFEADRWLAYVTQAFSATRVRPVARVDRDHTDHSDWIIQAGGCVTTLDLGQISRRYSRESVRDWPVDTRVRSVGDRFVLVLDHALRQRCAYRYVAGARLASPIELAQLAGALRTSD